MEPGESTLSDVVAANLRTVRGRRGLSVRQLSARLAELGYTLSASGIVKAEASDPERRRRVDVEDLIAFALALDTSPVTLLSPVTSLTVDADVRVSATAGRAMGAYELDQWLRGLAPYRGSTREGVAAYFDTAPDDIQRAHRLDQRKHPAREALKGTAALVDTALDDFDPDGVYVGVAAEDRQAYLAEQLRGDAKHLSRALRNLADELERVERERIGDPLYPRRPPPQPQVSIVVTPRAEG